MDTLAYDFDGMTITLTRPLARHVLEAEVMRGLLINAWAEETGKPGALLPDLDWRFIYEFAEVFTGVAHVDNPTDYMPEIPLPFNNAAKFFAAYNLFWEGAPLGFITEYQEAAADIEGGTDPNV